ncbi:unnamed protein product [Staurois parvus]|uniref:Uncharacterized protein n=1 Tax=Staurois parvus TaxID=386267 RepID=A0ABN9HRL9_9NEOB|nr:unnamed protein product [Staurois parvus]
MEVGCSGHLVLQIEPLRATIMLNGMEFDTPAIEGSGAD